MRVWRWLLVAIIALPVFVVAFGVTMIGGGALTGLVGMRIPAVVAGLALVVALVAVVKRGRLVMD